MIKTTRVFNFAAGPAIMPGPVLEEAQRDLVSLPGVGMSVMEISHRSKTFEEILNKAIADVRDLAGIPADYRILMLQGGASLQFSMVPMNLLTPGTSADYIDTVLSRLTILGAVYLTFVALLPDFLARGFRFASLPWIGARLETMLPRFFSEGFGFNFYFGGTSLLIVVGVAIDTVQQVESKLVEHHYTGFLKKSRIRGRRT